MKKIIPVILFLVIVTACSNSADKEKTKDSVNVKSSNGNGEPSKDTASYDRMSNKISDSTQH
jgi:hypothetical protein